MRLLDTTQGQFTQVYHDAMYIEIYSVTFQIAGKSTIKPEHTVSFAHFPLANLKCNGDAI